MKFTILTVFPEMFGSVLKTGVLRIARERGLAEYSAVDLRDYTEDAHRTVDDRPYGGGPGMVMKVEPVVTAWRDQRSRATGQPHTLLMTPQGSPFNQKTAERLAKMEEIFLIAGRYEGYDERIRKIVAPEEISLGDFVLAGGEIAAMAVIEAIVRLLPGVLGCGESVVEESFSDTLLEYPQYTRPADFEGHLVPDILVSGDHGKVAEWRRRQALKRTEERRPDLLERYEGKKDV